MLRIDRPHKLRAARPRPRTRLALETLEHTNIAHVAYPAVRRGFERILARVPDKKEAAKRLNMGLSSLYRKIAELGIQV